MRAIAGVASMDSGAVRWSGVPIGPGERRRIGYMPEERGLYPAMRVLKPAA
jgi:ABC-2 type transport system ATP-binding protein